MICIAVVDDERAVCDELLFFLKEYEMKFKMIFDISIYYNGENLLADLEDDIHFDLKQHRIISTYKQNHPAKC